MTDHKVVSRAEGQAARDELLRREKEHTRAGDELARQRRELPWVAISKEYVLDTEGGPRPLVGLFDGRSQLMVYHFMELLMKWYFILDRVPKGRDEDAGVQTWIRRHDEYA